MKTTIWARTSLAKLAVPAMFCVLACLAFALCPIRALCQTPYAFTTLADNKTDFHFKPKSIAVDSAGNVYFADPAKQVICRMQPSGRITIIAGRVGVPGSNDGPGRQAGFSFPRGIAIDPAGNIYVADTGNNTIRRISPDGVVTTIAGLAGTFGCIDGKGIDARFNYPVSVAVDPLGNIYVADLYNCTIRKVTSYGVVTTIAGQPGIEGGVDGMGNRALFSFPIGVAVDNSGNVYVADMMNNAIRKVTTAGMVITFAGKLSYTPGNADGAGSSARFCHPCGVAVDKAGNIYVADSGNDTIRCITPGRVVITLAGLPGQPGFADGIGAAVRFWHPTGLAPDRLGNLYVTDLDNSVIRKGSAASTNTNTALSLKASGTPNVQIHLSSR